MRFRGGRHHHIFFFRFSFGGWFRFLSSSRDLYHHASIGREQGELWLSNVTWMALGRFESSRTASLSFLHRFLALRLGVEKIEGRPVEIASKQQFPWKMLVDLYSDCCRCCESLLEFLQLSIYIYTYIYISIDPAIARICHHFMWLHLPNRHRQLRC